MKHCLIIGATSAIAQQTARHWAAAGDRLFLIGRDAERTRVLASDLKVRGAAATEYAVADLNDFASHAGLLATAEASFGPIDVALIAHGTLGDQAAGERDFSVALRELNTNALSVLSLLTPLGNSMEARRKGQLVVIGSVAGDRGRATNYVYGTAKAAVECFCSGLRVRLARAGVGLLLVKPGLVDTPMTAAFTKGALWSTPERVAQDIVRGVERGQTVIYTPRFWSPVMALIRHMPQPLFLRTRF
jgi:short-subunit dehydrogenase